jgi:hypothetical protein
MMSYLYQYRVLKTRENFEFADTIKEGKPEMQMREMINISFPNCLNTNYFHGLYPEARHTENLKDELLDFISFCKKLDEVIKKECSGVFTFTPKPEDILTMIIGSLYL